MIEFNLLPDIKVEYLKTEKIKRQVFSVSVMVAVACVGILVLLFAVLQLQNHQISNNKKDIQKYTQELTGTTDINKVLTIQNQLTTVVTLNKQTPVTSRLYSYLPQLVPRDVSISHLTLDFSTNSLKISGTAPKLSSVNTFADTLKFANYKTNQNSAAQKAFSSVTLQSFTRDQSGASFNFMINFDPLLFDRSLNVQLVVPTDYISTRSFTELPSVNLFNKPSSKDRGGSQ